MRKMEKDSIPGLSRTRPRSFVEWKMLRRWGRIPSWEEGVPGYLLRMAREESGLTQRELAVKLGVSQQAVAQAERWNANPTVGLIRSWAAACGRRIELDLRPEGREVIISPLATTMLSDCLFHGWPRRLFFLQAGSRGSMFMIPGAVLGLFQHPAKGRIRRRVGGGACGSQGRRSRPSPGTG